MVQRLGKTVRISLESITCTHTHDEGSIQIYGDLWALGFYPQSEGVFVEGSRENLWNRAEDNDLVMGLGNTHFVNATKGLVIFTTRFRNLIRPGEFREEVRPTFNDQLRIGGRIVDNEGFLATDDLLGDGFRIINSDNLPRVGTQEVYSVGFLGHGKEVVARFWVGVSDERWYD